MKEDLKWQDNPRHVAGWDYLCISGAPKERGYQHGSLMAERIVDCINKKKKLVYIQTGMEWDFFRNNAKKMWCSDEIAKKPAYKDYFDEILGISKGVRCQVPRFGNNVR